MTQKLTDDNGKPLLSVSFSVILLELLRFRSAGAKLAVARVAQARPYEAGGKAVCAGG